MTTKDPESYTFDDEQPYPETDSTTELESKGLTGNQDGVEDDEQEDFEASKGKLNQQELEAIYLRLRNDYVCYEMILKVGSIINFFYLFLFMIPQISGLTDIIFIGLKIFELFCFLKAAKAKTTLEQPEQQRAKVFLKVLMLITVLLFGFGLMHSLIDSLTNMKNGVPGYGFYDLMVIMVGEFAKQFLRLSYIVYLYYTAKEVDKLFLRKDKLERLCQVAKDL